MKSFIRAWNESKILPVFLFFLVVILFAIIPFSYGKPVLQTLVTLFLASNLILGIHSIKANIFFRMITIVFALIVTIIEFLSLDSENAFLRASAILIWIIIISLLLYVFLIKVFENKENGLHRIQGGIACYLLIGLLFAFIFYFIYTIFPFSFQFNTTLFPSGLNFYSFVYYSYVTLCTVGYGDITPIIPFSQSASVLEAILGVLFPTVLIGYLISDFSSKRKS